MRKEVSFYRCNHCGNLVAFIKESGVPVICCGEAMLKLEANVTDAATEKHVPVINHKESEVQVSVGSVLHPMLPEHSIEWIACVAGDKVELRYLEPGVEPSAHFDDVSSGTIYAYCNLHGLWKSDF